MVLQNYVFLFTLTLVFALGSTQISKNKELSRDMQFSALLPAYQIVSEPKLPMELPAGNAAWVLEIEVQGGLTGEQKSYLLLTSDGKITIEESGKRYVGRCSNEIQEVNSAIQRMQTEYWHQLHTNLRTVSLCQDCYKTKFTLYIYDLNGRPAGYRVYWDEANLGDLIKDVAAIHSATLKIRHDFLNGREQ